MKNLAAIGLALLFATICSANELAGLWEAKKRFGPDARGTIVLRREGTAWTADFFGRVVPIREERGLLTFSIPEGSFRARIGKDGIDGHWTQAQAVVTPVRLQPDGVQRWRGEIAPLEDELTFYLMLGPNGEAFLRNPERNAAIFWKMNRFARDGRAVKLYSGETVLAEGTYDAERDVLTIVSGSRWLLRLQARAREQRVLPARQDTGALRVSSAVRSP